MMEWILISYLQQIYRHTTNTYKNLKLSCQQIIKIA